MLIDIPARVRWRDVIDTLDRSGINNAELARRIGVNRSTVNRWGHGTAEPTFTVGVKVLKFYVAHVQHTSE